MNMINMNSAPKLKDRAEGTLLGLAIGDALGTQVEFDFADDIREKERIGAVDLDEMRAGGTHGLPAGAWTDDTSMALCLADSLLEKQGYDSNDVMLKYNRWYNDGYRSSIGVCFDIGQQIYLAITQFLSDENKLIDPSQMSDRAGNGGIMRLAPAVIATANQPIVEAMRLAKISSRETHYSLVANAGAEIFGAMLWQALHESDKNKVTDVAAFSTGKTFDDILTQINSVRTKYELEDRDGYIVDSLKIAVWGFRNFTNFADGLKAVIRLGGDTDTNGAIYGQLAGAFYGREAIPQNWQDEVISGDEIVQLADKLLALKKCPIIKTRFKEDL